MAPSVTVFEIVNDLSREIFVSARAEGLEDVLADYRRAPPKEIAHWDLGKVPREAVRVIESSLEADGAAAFIHNYTQTDLPDGWRYLTGR